MMNKRISRRFRRAALHVKLLSVILNEEAQELHGKWVEMNPEMDSVRSNALSELVEKHLNASSKVDDIEQMIHDVYSELDG